MIELDEVIDLCAKLKKDNSIDRVLSLLLGLEEFREKLRSKLNDYNKFYKNGIEYVKYQDMIKFINVVIPKAILKELIEKSEVKEAKEK